MNFRLILSVVYSVILYSAVCFSLTVSMSVEAENGVLSNTPNMLTLTWKGQEGQSLPSGPVTLVFSNYKTGTDFRDIHYPPADLRPDNTHDWTAAYTIPVYIPYQKNPGTWTVSVITDDDKYLDVHNLFIRKTSAFQNLSEVAPVFGWKRLTSTDTIRKQGFHNTECLDHASDCWIWMTGTGHIEIPNPLMEIVLKLSGWIPDNLNPGLDIQVGDTQVETGTAVDNHFHIEQTIPLSGFEEFITITVNTDESYVPADDGVSTDTRELGIMIREFQIFPADTILDDRPMFELLYPLENTLSLWRMGDIGRLQIRNPGRDFQVFLKCQIPQEFFMPGIRLQMFLNGVSAGYTAPDGPVFTFYYHVTREAVADDSDISIDLMLEYPFSFIMPRMLFRLPGMMVSQLWIQ